MLGKFVQLRLQGVRDPFISMANGGKAKAPPAPDYTAAAQATAAGNLEAAKYTTQANRVNQVTPYGNLTYSMTPTLDQGSYDKAMADYQSQLANYNTALAKYNSQSNNNTQNGINGIGMGNVGTGSNKKMPLAPVLPTANAYQTGQSWTATQTLSPEQQAIYDQESKLNAGLLSTANTGLNYANQVLSKPGVDMSKLPSLTSNVQSDPLATGYNVERANRNLDLSNLNKMQTSINTEGLPSYGINPGETYSDAIMRRLQPDLERQRASEESRLANQGIGLGSNAYSTAKDILGRQQNDALTSAIVQGMGVGLQANQQQFGQNAAQAELNNAANNQTYQQALASGQFSNQAAGQNTANNADLAAFGNQARGQQFQQGMANANLGNAAQQTGFQQTAYNQMQPINVINALRTGAQVQNPSYAQNAQMPQTAGPDLLGATNQSYNAQVAAANAQNAASGNFMGGLMNLGGAYLMSDENLKTDIKRIGTHDLGVGIYSYNYKEGYDLPTGIQIGVLAQEVEKIIPEAVIVTDSGFKAVNYAML